MSYKVVQCFLLVACLISLTLSASLSSVYEVSNAYCSQTPTIFPFPGGNLLDGTYTLIRYGDIDYSEKGEEPPKCGTLSIESEPSTNVDENRKLITSTRDHPFEPNSFYTKKVDAVQTNPIITPARWVSTVGLFQFVDGPLGRTRSLMFLKYTRDRNAKVEAVLYASCGMHPNGGIIGPGVGDPSMSEWGILVRKGQEDAYQDDIYLGALFDEALASANLPPVSNMTYVPNRNCD